MKKLKYLVFITTITAISTIGYNSMCSAMECESEQNLCGKTDFHGFNSDYDYALKSTIRSNSAIAVRAVVEAEICYSSGNGIDLKRRLESLKNALHYAQHHGNSHNLDPQILRIIKINIRDLEA
jgi:hypothetical protein